jgi:hypothetical protein
MKKKITVILTPDCLIPLKLVKWRKWK